MVRYLKPITPMNFLGKVSNFVSTKFNSMMQQNESSMDEERMSEHNSLIHLRQFLVQAIYNGTDYAGITEELAKLDCPMATKYLALNVEQLIKWNSQTLEELQSVVTALSGCLKFARHLAKPIEKRSPGWWKVSFANKVVHTKIKHMKGFEGVFDLMGYTELDEHCMSFASNASPEPQLVVGLMADMVLLKGEIKLYIQGRHKHAKAIDELVPQSTRDELKAFQLSGECYEEDDMTDVPMTLGNLDYATMPNVDESTQEETTEPPKPTAPSESKEPLSDVGKTDMHHQSNPVEPKLGDRTADSPGANDGQEMFFLQATASENVDEPDTVIEQPQDLAIQDLVEPESQVSNTLASSGGRNTSSSSARIAFCEVCGEEAAVVCMNCQTKPLCDSCNESWHKHPQRRNHDIKQISSLNMSSLESQSSVLIDGAYGVMAKSRHPMGRFGGGRPRSGGDQSLPSPEFNQLMSPLAHGASEMVDSIGASAMYSNGRQDIHHHNQQQQLLEYQRHQAMLYHQTRVQGMPQDMVYHREQPGGSRAETPLSITGTGGGGLGPAAIQHGQGSMIYSPGRPDYPMLSGSGQPRPGEMFGPSFRQALAQQNQTFYGGSEYAMQDYQRRMSAMNGQSPMTSPPEGASRFNPSNIYPHSMTTTATAHPGHMPYVGDFNMNNAHHVAPHYDRPYSLSGVQPHSAMFQNPQHMAGNPLQYQYTPDMYRQDVSYVPAHIGQPGVGSFHGGLQHMPRQSIPGTPQHNWAAVQDFETPPSFCNQEGKKSSFPSSGYAPTTEIIPSNLVSHIMKEPNQNTRRKLCAENIKLLEMDIQDLDTVMNENLAEESDDFCESKKFKDMTKRKRSMIKEKKALEAYRFQIDQETEAQVIHYPPPLNTQHGQRLLQDPPLNMPSPQQYNFQHFKGPKGSQTLTDKNIQNVGIFQNTPGLVPEMTGLLNKLSLQQQLHQTQGSPKMPVENSCYEENMPMHNPSTSPPALPPRPKQIIPDHSKNLLNMSFAPPKDPEPAKPKFKEWECEFCTFINYNVSPKCEMCEKTSHIPRLASEDQGETLATEPPSADPTVENDDFMHLLNELKAGQSDAETQDARITNGVNQQKQERAREASERIAGLQDQVMLEKKKAQEAYNNQMQSKGDNETTMTTANVDQRISPEPADQRISPESQTNRKAPSSVSPSPPSPGRPGSGRKQSSSSSSTAGQSHSESAQEESQPASYQDLLSQLTVADSINTMQKEGAQLAHWIKLADQQGFETEAVQIALGVCKNLDNKNPLDWLMMNWKKNVMQVASRASRQGRKEQQNSVGEVSELEAQSAYVLCHGNLKEAAQLCVDQRKELFAYLSSLGDLPREEILDAMYQSHGDRQISESLLVSSKVYPFLERIWAERDLVRDNRFALEAVADGRSQLMCHSFSTSIINHADFQKALVDSSIDRDRRIRMILVESRLQGWVRAEMVIDFLEQPLAGEEITVEDVVEAVRNCRDKQSALAYLQQECQICYATYPMNKIRSLICQCKLCESCLKLHFEISIKEKHVRHWTCPACTFPEMNNSETASDYLQFLGMLLQPLVDQELLTLFETKTRDWFLQREANFRWCAHCASGFIAEDPRQLRMTCPQCKMKTCFQCKKQWEDQHEGLSCEEFNQWKIDNDPTNQSVGLAKHLDENGIDCPNCKMRFALAKGGCMHFKCPQCVFEFCSGCNQPYHHKNMCLKYKGCKQLGFHCHCPRDCFSNLRDYGVERLQKLLKMEQKPFNIAVPSDQEDADHCPVMEQKELDTVKNDERCGKDAVEGYAGLCEMHYKEYLTGLINQHRLDPVAIMEKDEILAFLKKCDIQPPKQKSQETAEIYVNKLTQIIKDKLRLRQ